MGSASVQQYGLYQEVSDWSNEQIAKAVASLAQLALDHSVGVNTMEFVFQGPVPGFAGTVALKWQGTARL